MTDASTMANHFLPEFGSRSLAELASEKGEVELLDWVVRLRECRSSRDGTPLAARTVRNIATAVRVFFADALERKVIRRNPAAVWKVGKHLPKIEDKHPGWRRRAGFALEDVVRLTTDERITEDRRVLYALRFLGGPRPGETANARWRDLDRTSRPLWRLTLGTAWNSQSRSEKSTKTGAELNIPVHPVLQKLLEHWEATGWEEFIGRKPKPDDLILPRQDGRQRSVWDTNERFKLDLGLLGIPAQRQYESRSTFRNLALRAGASEFHLNLITHPKPKQASDFYTRLEMQWNEMCRAVLAIDAAAWEPPPATVTSAGVTVGVTAQRCRKDKAPERQEFRGLQLARPRGFEPLAFGFVGWVNSLANQYHPCGAVRYAS
jgi:integrase